MPPSVIVVGGGIIGCATAYELAKAGSKVTVFERATPGAEASSAAAGLLTVGALAAPSPSRSWPSTAGPATRTSRASFGT